MKRKYDLRNKRNFIIILGLSVLIIVIFSLFIYKYVHTSKIEYSVDVGSVVQDVNKNYLTIDEPATLKVRWNESYYLIYQDKKINLGKKVIIYNTVDGSMKLYGKFYEIGEDGKVNQNDKETVLANTTDTKFYKLADREYLLVDRKITSDDRSIETDNYMLVELDKMGNAKLSNNKLNLKTITPTKLVTSKYVFDIANESLKYNKLDIDLKKIIGSSNQYKEEEKPDKPDENGGTGGGNGNNDFNNETDNNVINEKEQSGDTTTIEELKNKVKMTSIVLFREGLTQIDVDYVVYDPYNEYKTVYVEVEKPGKVEKLYLSKNDTHLIIDKLLPNTSYKLNFVYTTTDSETGEIKENKFEEITAKTKMPVYEGDVTRVSTYLHKLTYTVKLQSGYTIDTVNVDVKFYYQELDESDNMVTKQATIPATLTVSGNAKSVSGTIDITDYDIVDINKASVIIKSVASGDNVITFS